MNLKLQDAVIAVIGLGYVGLPLAVEFGKKFPVVGYDIDESRVRELRGGEDRTREVTKEELATAVHLSLSSDARTIARANVYIITTPTPIDEHKQPDLQSLLGASQAVGRNLAPGDVVIYESTVFPGATEERCVPVLESVSGLRYNKDFFVGYSPERINPGDKTHRLADIMKVTSGSTDETATFVDALYGEIVRAGTYRAASIRVAEAAKVIENTQRDVNIALINELAILFNRMGIDTQEVLRAASTKWNFLNFQPGLVGGHCIGVDPYYLTHKAQSLGYHPEIILAGRRLNDSMAGYVASQLVKRMTREGIPVRDSKVLILGVTFKENTPDVRNSKVFDLVRELRDYEVQVDVYDPWADPQAVKCDYGISMIESPIDSHYEAIVLAVPHRLFLDVGGPGLRAFGASSHIFYDLKSALEATHSDLRL